jgi:hypothetical protein
MDWVIAIALISTALAMGAGAHGASRERALIRVVEVKQRRLRQRMARGGID